MNIKFISARIAAIAFLLLALLPAAIHPNDCSPASIPDTIEGTPLIFSGRLISDHGVEAYADLKEPKKIKKCFLIHGKRQCEWRHESKVPSQSNKMLFVVDRVWKGKPGKYVAIWSEPDWMWSPGAHPPDTRFLVFAWKSRVRVVGESGTRRVYMTWWCTRNGTEAERSEELAALGPGHPPK